MQGGRVGDDRVGGEGWEVGLGGRRESGSGRWAVSGGEVGGGWEGGG